MGTRSVIAVPDAEHGWRGRYVHWDGYPTGVGEAVRQIVVRDGLTTAIRRLTEDRYGWSQVNAVGPHRGELTSNDGRFAAEDGYGEAYTTEQGQSSADEWIYAGGGDWGTEWAYLLGEGGIAVFERRYGQPEADEGHGTGMFGYGASDSVAGGYWLKLGFVSFTDEDGMARIEKDA